MDTNKILVKIEKHFKEKYDFEVDRKEDKIIVNNSLADFKSKIDKDGYRMGPNQQVNSRILDWKINEELCCYETYINENTTCEANVLCPGNIIEVNEDERIRKIKECDKNCFKKYMRLIKKYENDEDVNKHLSKTLCKKCNEIVFNVI